MEDGIERSMSMLIQENEQEQTVRKSLSKTTSVESPPKAAFGWPPAVSVESPPAVSVLSASTMPEQVHPIGLSLPTDMNASSYPLTTDMNHLTSTNSGS